VARRTYGDNGLVVAVALWTAAILWAMVVRVANLLVGEG
jgi:hypothetical protein